MLGLDPLILAIVMIVGLVMLATMSTVLTSLYAKCGPNQAMIISGMSAGEDGRTFKIVVGGGAIVFPLIQQRQLLSLETMTIATQSESSMITKDSFELSIGGVAQVKVKSDEFSISNAAECLLGKDESEIASIAQTIIVGHMRALVGTLTRQELTESLSGFVQTVQDLSTAELAKLGLTIVSLKIPEMTVIGELPVKARETIKVTAPELA